VLESDCVSMYEMIVKGGCRSVYLSSSGFRSFTLTLCLHRGCHWISTCFRFF